MKPPHLRRRVPRVKPGPGEGSRLCTWCAGTGIGYAGRGDPCARCDGEGWVFDLAGQLVSRDLPRGYRWTEYRPEPPVGFAQVADALAAAAFASDLPAGFDTLHVLHWPDGGCEVVASGYGGGFWLVAR